jgi:hypothetical protein
LGPYITSRANIAFKRKTSQRGKKKRSILIEVRASLLANEQMKHANKYGKKNKVNE